MEVNERFMISEDYISLPVDVGAPSFQQVIIKSSSW